MRPIFQPSPDDWPFLRRLAWVIVFAALLVVIWRAAELLILVFGSIIGATLFHSAARLFRRAGVGNGKLALGLGILLVLSLFGMIGWLLVVQFGAQLAEMLGDLPGTIQSVQQTLSTSAVGQAIVDATEAATGGSTIADRLGSLMLGAGEVLLNFLILLVGALFIAGNPALYRRGILLLTPPKARPAMEHALGQASASLRLWIKAKLITMAVMTVLLSTGLWLAGVESWAALGLLAGLSEFVPYVGPAVAMVPALLLAAAAGGDVLWQTIAAFAVARVIEAYALTPFINREVVKIPPALTLFVILAVGAVFGVFGMFFAGAFLVIVFVMVRELYLRDTLGEDLKGLPRGTKQ